MTPLGPRHIDLAVNNMSSEEKLFYGQLFRQADVENLGIIRGEVAVKFFDRASLYSRILGEVCIILSLSAEI